MEQDKMRADFEAWVRRIVVDVTDADFERDGEIYKWDPLNMAFAAWQASREAVVVELPEEDKAGFGGADGPLGPSIEQIEAAGYNCGVKACRAAIHAAGIRTR